MQIVLYFFQKQITCTYLAKKLSKWALILPIWLSIDTKNPNICGNFSTFDNSQDEKKMEKMAIFATAKRAQILGEN